MQRDVVLRWIEQIVATVRRMLLGPSAVDPAVVEGIVDDAIAHLLGPLTLLVPHLDVPSAAHLLRDQDRVLGLATLLAVKADVLERTGRSAEAAALRRRAEEFQQTGQLFEGDGAA